MSTKFPLLALLAVVVGLIVSSMYTVSEKEKAIIFQLGELKDADIQPGLHWKWPLVNNVKKFDSRILTLDAQPESFLTSEKKNVLVDFFVKWRIEDVGQFYVATSGGDEDVAKSRMAQIIKDELRDEFSKRTIQEAISGGRNEITVNMKKKANAKTKELGVEVVDVRVSRIDYSQSISGSVYDRMKAERFRVAKDLRARGKEEAEVLRAKADRERQVIIANAYRDSEKVRGEGDAKATEIYAKAYSQDEEFYSFIRSLSAYTKTFSGKNDILIMEPDSEFFRYFKKSEQ